MKSRISKRLGKEDRPPLVKPIQERKRKLDTFEVFSLYMNGMSVKDIASKFGVSVASVYPKLQKLQDMMGNLIPEDVTVFREHRGTLLDAVQMRVLAEMSSDAKIKRAPLRDLSTAFEKLYNANRLEMDKSTTNVAMKHESFLKMVKDMASQRGELPEQI